MAILIKAIIGPLIFGLLVFGEQPHQLVELESPSLPKFSVSLSRNGLIAAAVCKDEKVRIWALPSGRIKRVIGPDRQGIFITASSDDGTLVAGTDWSGGFGVWETNTGNPVFNVQRAHYGIALTFSHAGKRLAIAPANEPAQVYSISSGRKLLELPDAFGGAQAVAFSPDGSRIATAGSDTVVRIFDSRNGELIGRYTDFLLEPFATAFTVDGSKLLTAGADKVIALLDASTSAVIQKSARLADPVQSLGVSPDGRLAAAFLLNTRSAMKPALALVLEVGSGRTVQQWLPPGPMVGSVWTETGNLLAAIRAEHGIGIWRLR